MLLFYVVSEIFALEMLFHSISHLALPMLNGASNPAGPRARPTIGLSRTSTRVGHYLMPGIYGIKGHSLRDASLTYIE